MITNGMNKETRLKVAIVLSSIFMCIEVVGGYLANSIAIYSDAAHLLTDIAGFAISLLAAIASKAPGTKHLTFGLARAEVFGALLSVLSLWVITFFLLFAAYFRGMAWFEGRPETVDGFLMFAVACFGILVNLCLGFVFHQEHGGAMHPAHSHEHGHSCGSHGGGGGAAYQALETDSAHGGHDHSHGHGNDSGSGSCGGGHDHGHGHGHKHEGGSRNNSEKQQVEMTDKTALLGSASSSKKAYTTAAAVSPAHDHAHAHHAQESLSSHSGHGHDHGHGGMCTGHGHDSHDEDILPQVGGGDVNLEAAYLHVLTDLIQSIGVAIAGLIMWFKPEWEIIDPACTLIFSIIAMRSTLPLLGKIFTILFEGTPAHVSSPCVVSGFLLFVVWS
jgi:solute carrier family 30 (zinc transporter), member 2